MKLIEGVLGAVASWIIAVISAGGYAGIAGLMALESACIPLPSEVIMPVAGYLASTGRFNLWLVATAGAVGCNIGSTLAYAVGAHGGRSAIERWGRYVLLDRDDLDRRRPLFSTFRRSSRVYRSIWIETTAPVRGNENNCPIHAGRNISLMLLVQQPWFGERACPRGIQACNGHYRHAC